MPIRNRRDFTGQGLGAGPLARSDFDEDAQDGGNLPPAKGFILAENSDVIITEAGDNLQLE